MNRTRKRKRFCFIGNFCFISSFLIISANLKLSEQIDSNNCLISSNVNNYIKHEILKCTSLEHHEYRSKKVYRCSCKNNSYAEPVDSYNNNNNHTNIEQCVEAHPGMAIKGSNLVYKQWISREDCFNLCLKTNRKYGDFFDCKSFEHWHSECSYEYLYLNKSSDYANKKCAEYLNLHSNLNETKFKRKQQKIDLCVLSNQTMSKAGNDFEINFGVTYYEILCNKKIEETTTSQSKTQDTIPTVFKDTTRNYQNFINTTSLLLYSTLAEEVFITTKSTLKHKQKVSVCELCSESLYCQDNKIFNGVSCHAVGVESKCGQYSMDIYISKEFAIKLDVKLSDIYINEYDDNSDDADAFRNDANSICKSSLFNKTHVKFSVPYNSCGTRHEKIKTSSEIIYSNQLYVKNENSNNYLIAFKCRIYETVSVKIESLSKINSTQLNDPVTVVRHESTEVDLKHNNIIESHNDSKCIINVLKVEIKFFNDKNFQNELIKNNPTTIPSISYNQKFYIEVIVLYSDEAYKILQNLALKNAELTIYNFWLTIGNKIEYFIQNGCPNNDKNVVFYESVVERKTAIRFSIKSNILKFHTRYQVKFHSQLEICIENEEDDTQINYSDYNYIKLKYCEKISDICKNGKNYTKSSCHLNWQSGPFNSKESTKPLFIAKNKNKTNIDRTEEIDLAFISNEGSKLLHSNSYSMQIFTYIFIYTQICKNYLV